MAQPTLHFAVGATCTTVMTLAVGPLRRRWYRVGPLLAMMGGVWACLPDLDHLLGLVNWPVAERMVDFENTHARSLLWNLFFFHGWMDQYWAGGTIVGLIWTLGLVGAFFWLSARRVAKLERRLSAPASRPGNEAEADHQDA